MESPEVIVDLTVDPMPTEVAQLAGEEMERAYEDDLSELACLDENEMWERFDELLDAAIERAYDLVTVGTTYEKL